MSIYEGEGNYNYAGADDGSIASGVDLLAVGSESESSEYGSSNEDDDHDIEEYIVEMKYFSMQLPSGEVSLKYSNVKTDALVEAMADINKKSRKVLVTRKEELAAAAGNIAFGGSRRFVKENFKKLKCYKAQNLPPTHSLGTAVAKGHFGSVYFFKGVCVKTISARSMLASTGFKEEMAALQAINHRNVVKFYGYHRSATNELRMIMEKLPLVFHLGHQGCIPNVKAIALCAAEGLFDMHMKGLLHIDFAARNVFITSSETASVGDFGFTRSYDKKGWVGLGSFAVGQRLFPFDIAAPELEAHMSALLTASDDHPFPGSRERVWSLKTDVFAFGLFLCHLHYGVECARTQVRENLGLTKEERDQYFSFAKKVPQAMFELLSFATVRSAPVGRLRDVIVSCMDPNPKKRPLMGTVVDELRLLDD